MNKQLLFLALLLSSLVSVRAGGSSQCFSPTAPDSDLPNVRNVPLIDSFASFGGNFFSNDSDMDGQGWMLLDDTACPQRATVCEQTPDQDNWLYTFNPMMAMLQTGQNLTSIQVLMKYTTNCTEPTCDPDALGLYVLHSSEIFADSTNFSAYDLVRMPVPNNDPVSVTLTDSPYLLGIRDSGTCVTLLRVQVYYSACVVPFASVGEIAFENSVTVECVSNTVFPNVPTTCSAGGVLDPLFPCDCRVGFSGEDGMNCVACPAGTYKPLAGSDGCLPCPIFSEATSPGSSECSCLAGRSRSNPADIATSCDLCAPGYFMSDGAETQGQCLQCPAGSDSPGGSVSSCTCDSGVVTALEATTTTRNDCDKCASNYYRSSTVCVACPANSVRAFAADADSCSCEDGRATAAGAATTSGDSCNNCALSHYLDNGNCVMCPSNSEQSSSNEETCACLDNRVTGTGASTTTSDQCDGCATTYYLNSGSCSMCPERSTAVLPSATTCQCDDGRAFSDGSQESTSASCLVVLGFTMDSLTLTEGSSSRRAIGVSIRAGESITMNIHIDSTLSPSNDPFFINGDAVFTNDDEVDAPIDIQGNQLALDEYSTYTFTIPSSSGYIAGGMVAPGEQVYPQLVVTVTEDDDVRVGFTQERVQFNETQGQGMVTVSKVGGTSSPLTLRITTSRTNNAINVTTSIMFSSGQDDSRDVPFVIIDDNSGSETISSTMLTLVFVGPSGFEDSVLFGEPGLSRTIIVDILNDEPPPTTAPLALEAIIGICVAAALLALLVFFIFILVVCICRLRSINSQGFYTTHEDQTKEPPTMLRYSASLRSISSQTVVPVENTQGSVTKENEFYV